MGRISIALDNEMQLFHPLGFGSWRVFNRVLYLFILSIQSKLDELTRTRFV